MCEGKILTILNGINVSRLEAVSEAEAGPKKAQSGVGPNKVMSLTISALNSRRSN